MITPLGSVGAAWPSAAIAPTAPTAPTGVGPSAPTSGGGFDSLLTHALSGVEGAQHKADDLATKAATGNLSDVQSYMVAAEQANVDTQLTVAVRNNAVQAFQQIMGMQL